MHTIATGNGQEQPNINVPLRSTSPKVKDFLNDLELNEEENGNDCEEDTDCKDEINLETIRMDSTSGSLLEISSSQIAI